MTPLVFAQLSGKISDENLQPVPSATVLLLNWRDSSLVKTTLSNTDGIFQFPQLKAGEYVLTVSFIGYQKYYSGKIVLMRENQLVMLPAVSLQPLSSALKTVTITAQKPVIEMQADKLVMNVQNTISATGNTALEVLQKAPGVVVNQNDEIMVNGKAGILIYLDGKQTYMSQTDLITYLKNMRSDQIDKLEIMSNPSAKYDAAGKAIINIITIRNKDIGTNGTLNAGMGLVFGPTVPAIQTSGLLSYKYTGLAPRYNAGLVLNNRKGKVNLFGNLYYNNTLGLNNSQTYKQVAGSLYNQYAYSQGLSYNLNYKAGIDYFVNKNTTLGMMLSGNDGGWRNNLPSVGNGYFMTLDGSPQSSALTTSNGFNTWHNNTLNGNFKHSFDSTGRVLSIDIDYSLYNTVSGEHGLNTNFFDANGQATGSPLNITSDIPDVYHIVAVKADYSTPLSRKAKLDIGMKSSWVNSDNDIRFYNNERADIGRTNHFIYTENINALYGNLNKEFNTIWSLQLGLRMEYTRSEGNSLTLNDDAKHRYVNLFPSFFLKQNVDKDNELSYSYSRRITRPAYSTLNPFIYFSDPYTYSIGNENIKPSYTDSYSINYTLKHTFVATLGYSNTSSFMAQLYENAIDNPTIYAKLSASSAGTGVDPGKITYLTTDNIARFQVYNLGFTLPVTIAPWWTMNNNLTLLYVKYQGTVSNYLLNYEIKPYNFYSAQDFKLPSSLMLEGSISYNSRNIYGQIQAREQYSVNFGLRKTLWDKKATFSLSVNDIFATNSFYGVVNTTGVIQTSGNKSTSRMASINFSYKFGNSNVKSARNRSTATEDERGRIK